MKSEGERKRVSCVKRACNFLAPRRDARAFTFTTLSSARTLDGLRKFYSRPSLSAVVLRLGFVPLENSIGLSLRCACNCKVASKNQHFRGIF